MRAESVAALESALKDRALEHAAEKDDIAKAACGFLPKAGGAVILDAGSSTGRMASMLPADLSLTVLTNGISLGHGLSNPTAARRRRSAR